MNEQDLQLALKPLKQELALFQLNTLDKLGNLEAALKSHPHPAIVINEMMEKKMDSVMEIILKLVDRVKVLEEINNRRNLADAEALARHLEPLVRRPKSLWEFW